MFRFESYKVKRRDNLADPDFWNFRFKDLDVRLATREKDSERIDNVVDQLEAIALQRLADTFTPLILEAQSRLNSLGASFSAESLDEKTIASSGAMEFALTEATAANYVYTDYVSLRATASPENQMLARVLSFDREAGVLYTEIVSSEGSGTFSGWLIRIGTPPETGHATRTDNPHEVTAAQVGAYTVAEAQAAITSIATALINSLAPISSALLKANNLSDLTDAALARAALGLGALATANSVGTGQIASSVYATVAQIRAKTAGKAVQIDTLFSASAPVPLVDEAVIAVNMAAGFNFSVTVAASRTLGFPTNLVVGQSGYIDVTEPAGGNCSLGFQAGYTFDQGVVPTLDLSAGRTTSLYYFVRSASEVRVAVAFKGVR